MKSVKVNQNLVYDRTLSGNQERYRFVSKEIGRRESVSFSWSSTDYIFLRKCINHVKDVVSTFTFQKIPRRYKSHGCAVSQFLHLGRHCSKFEQLT